MREREGVFVVGTLDQRNRLIRVLVFVLGPGKDWKLLVNLCKVSQFLVCFVKNQHVFYQTLDFKMVSLDFWSKELKTRHAVSSRLHYKYNIRCSIWQMQLQRLFMHIIDVLVVYPRFLITSWKYVLIREFRWPENPRRATTFHDNSFYVRDRRIL